MDAERSSASFPGRVHRAGGMKVFFRQAIMVLIMGVSVGYIMLWVFSPTHSVRKWFLKIYSATKTTYFGSQGSTILLYTSPILFLAVLGCFYLHLGKKRSENSSERNCKNSKFNRWKRPMIIKRLGVVCWMELAIFMMFIALLVWSFSYYLHTVFSEAARRATIRGEKIWQVKLDRIGLILGAVGNICLAFLFFPVTRGSSILPIFGLTSEGSIKYHIWVGHITMLLFTLHGFFYIIYWIVTNQLHEMLTWNALEVSNIAGELSLLFGLFLWVTTYPPIRQKMFELFFYTHYFYILFMVFYIFHLGISYCYTVLPGFFLFVVDRYLRFLQSRQGVCLVSARVLPCDTVELTFSKSQALSYTPTSIIFINVPSISRLQWHPYTISSNSNLEPDTLSVIIKTEGEWTKKLYQMLLSSTSPMDCLDVSIEGPYGPVATHFLRHDILVMVSGGSGIAPFISIIRELIYTSKTHNTKPPKILLISAFKHSSDLTMLDLILPLSTHPSSLSNLDLQVDAYVTREPQLPLESPKILHTIRFKPSPSATPLYPTLGPNAWLWLGAVISSSFIVFLLVMGWFTRYYIYPIDHNMNTIFSHSLQAMYNMLFICASIVITASIAFLWNKKQREREGKQIQSMENGGKDWELESLPQQYIAKSTKVHYGRRPELKKILSERKEPNVGVLVCGPKKMRHEVAAICSSGLGDNLHFESISFSW